MYELHFNIFLNKYAYLKKKKEHCVIIRLDFKFFFSLNQTRAYVQWAAQLFSHHYLISEEFSAAHAFGTGFMSYPTP